MAIMNMSLVKSGTGNKVIR